MSPQVFHGSESYPVEARPVLTIGNFDGVHRGHASLLKRLRQRADELEAPACVYTFEPSPRRVLQPDSCPPRVLPVEEKLRLLGEHGVDHVVLERFSRSFGAHPPLWFAQEIVASRLDPVAMVVGYDFRYGRGRAGDVQLLRQQIPGLSIEAVDALLCQDPRFEGGIISSSRVRESVASGEVALAAQLLGRPYHLQGSVVPGEQRGRTLGFPTANLDVDWELLPALGVYAVQVLLPDGELRGGVANLGTNPTFQGRTLSVEVHLFDLDADLYGQRLELRFIQRLRGERRFESSAALVAQIQQDVSAARAMLPS